MCKDAMQKEAQACCKKGRVGARISILKARQKRVCTHMRRSNASGCIYMCLSLSLSTQADTHTTEKDAPVVVATRVRVKLVWKRGQGKWGCSVSEGRRPAGPFPFPFPFPLPVSFHTAYALPPVRACMCVYVRIASHITRCLMSSHNTHTTELAHTETCTCLCTQDNNTHTRTCQSLVVCSCQQNVPCVFHACACLPVVPAHSVMLPDENHHRHARSCKGERAVS